MEIRLVASGERRAVLEASPLFDDAAHPEFAQRFLESVGHHLFIAYDAGAPVGFVSGVEMTHPDKGTEMFLYELAVAEPFRRRGIATALVSALRDLAKGRGCYGMWVLTDEDNAAARATYAATEAATPTRHLMFSWAFGRPNPD
jgi:ribosomal protein S18 acetylase RimI-like enzyme